MLASYDELREEIQLWLEREGEEELVDRLDTIVQMAESALNRKLVGYQREITVQLTTDAAGDVALPADFLGMKSVKFNGRPVLSSISGGTLNIAGGIRTYDVVYYAKLTPLTSDNQTNWLLRAAPDIYLDACLARANLFLENTAAAAVFMSQAEMSLAELTQQNTVAQYNQTRYRIAGPTP